MTRATLAAGLLVVPLAAIAAGAPLADDLRACSAVGDAAARLACYDALAGASTPGAATPASVVPTPPPEAAAPSPTPAAVPSFGEDSMRRPPTAREQEAIAAHLVGPFRGWDKDTVFELDNGQVWKSADYRGAVYRPSSPGLPVTIEKRWSGGYVMRVEGYSREVPVKRIK